MWIEFGQTYMKKCPSKKFIIITPHSLIHFSGIYIIDQKGKNQTSFIHNDFGYLDTCINTKNIEDIGEGTVMIFPSHLLHYVNPVDESRCTISFNITSTF